MVAISKDYIKIGNNSRILEADMDTYINLIIALSEQPTVKKYKTVQADLLTFTIRFTEIRDNSLNSITFYQLCTPCYYFVCNSIIYPPSNIYINDIKTFSFK